MVTGPGETRPIAATPNASGGIATGIGFSPPHDTGICQKFDDHGIGMVQGAVYFGKLVGPDKRNFDPVELDMGDFHYPFASFPILIRGSR